MKRKPITPRPRDVAASSPTNPFAGHWRLTKTELWDREALDLLGPAFIRFEDDRTGGFQFIAVRGGLDCRFSERGGLPAVEFSWEGDDEGDARSGRGWAILREGALEGRLFFHGGDDSWFVAMRASRSRPSQVTRRRTPRTRGQPGPNS